MISFLSVLSCILVSIDAHSADPPISDATGNCLACHAEATPGMVEDWRKISR